MSEYPENQTREYWNHILPVHWQMRDGTWDGSMYDSVVIHNEYGIGRFNPDDIVVDIGAHIGSFTWMAATHGANMVYAYEAMSSNFDLLVANTDPVADSVICEQVAVWRSDHHNSPRTLSIRANPDPVNTGGADVFGDLESAADWYKRIGYDTPVGEIEEVETIPFDDIINEAAKGSRRRMVRLVKIDCEGSEFPILFTSKKLRQVEEYVGEYHLGNPQIKDLPLFTEKNLRTLFIKNGFEYFSEPSNEQQGIFNAILKTE